MPIFCVGFITLLLFLNMAYYEYRFVKRDVEKDLIKAYVQLRLLRKYK